MADRGACRWRLKRRMAIQGDKRQRKETNDNQMVERRGTKERKGTQRGWCAWCAWCAWCRSRGRDERDRESVRRGGATRTLLEGRRLQVGVDEERCVDDTEHRRTGDCFEQDWDVRERHRRERSRQRWNETKRAAISSRGGM